MPRSEPIVTGPSVKKAVLELKGKSSKPTLRGIREQLGGGSLTDISATLKKILPEIQLVPEDLRTKLEPIMVANAEVVQKAVKEAVEAMGERLEILEACGAELEGALVDSLSCERSLNAENESLRNDLCARDATIKLMAESEAALMASIEEVKAELALRSIREEDYRKAKTEAAEARDRASRLEGRLQEMERKTAIPEVEKARRNSPAKKAKA